MCVCVCVLLKLPCGAKQNVLFALVLEDYKIQTILLCEHRTLLLYLPSVRERGRERGEGGRGERERRERINSMN